MTEKVLDTQFRDWLMQTPAPMLAVGEDGRIIWTNRSLEAFVGLPDSELLGHTRESLPSPTHRVLFEEKELIHLNGPGAPDRWLRCDIWFDEKQPTVRLHCYTDVTREIELDEQNRQLRETVDKLRTTDELTGLPNRRALSQQLELHVSRSRRYDNQLSIIHIGVACDEAAAQDAVAVAVAHHLRDRLRWADLVARWNEAEFVIVLPETEETMAREVGANLFAVDDPVTLKGEFANIVPRIAMGVAGWHRGDDSRTLLARAAADIGNGGHVSSA